MTLLVYRELTPENKSITNPTFTRFAYMEVLLVYTKNDLGGGGFAIILIVSKQQITIVLIFWVKSRQLHQGLKSRIVKEEDWSRTIRHPYLLISDVGLMGRLVGTVVVGGRSVCPATLVAPLLAPAPGRVVPVDDDSHRHQQCQPCASGSSEHRRRCHRVIHLKVRDKDTQLWSNICKALTFLLDILSNDYN